MRKPRRDCVSPRHCPALAGPGHAGAVVALMLLTCSAFAGTVTYNKTASQALADASGGIGPHTAATTTSTLSFSVPSGFGEVADVDVRVQLNHTNLRQLRIVLVAPGGTVTLLENGVNASGNFILGTNSASGANLENTWFDKDTLRPITDGAAPYSARFEADMAAVENRTPGQSSGTWELRITDYRAGDTGTLVSWSVTLKSLGEAQTFTVTNLADSGAGSLRDAVAKANANSGPSTIRLSSNLTEGTIDLTSGPIEIIDSNISNSIVPDTVLEFGDPRRVTVRNAGNGRVFTVSAGDVKIRGATIANGLATGAEGGGGIFNAGDLDVENCTIRDNTATDPTSGVARGGGIANLGRLRVERSTMSGNAAESGGAIYGAGDSTSVNTCTLANNSAQDPGAGSGGAVHVGKGSLSIVFTTISGNAADGFGGGVRYRPADGSFLNTALIAANTAPQGADVHGEFEQAFGSLIGDGSDANFAFQSGCIIGTESAPIDPLLEPLANNGGPTDTMALRRESRAVDAGYCLPINGFAPSDQRGVVALDLLSVGTSSDHSYECDCGAFELAPAVFANISTRLPVETGENVLIAGFIVTTPIEGATKQVFARGLGLSLQAAGVTNTLNDPILELYQGSTLIVSNDNWRDGQPQEIEATTIPPPNDLESAILRSLEATSYTAILRGKNAGTGVGLVELYDLATSSPAVVANISTRGFVRTGDNVMIAGFILQGLDPARILIRAIGPSLGASGVEQPLANPALELYDAEGTKIDENDDWQQQATQQIIANTGAAPSDPAEAAIIADLKAGVYTAVMRGADGGIGVGVIEAYNIR